MEIVAYRFQCAVPHPLHPLDTNVSKLKKDAAPVQREPLVDMAKFTSFCDMANAIMKHGQDFVWILAGRSETSVERIKKR